MTIRKSINASELNGQLSNLDCCARHAPARTYDEAKKVSALVSDIADHIMTEIRCAGLIANSDDRMREVEAAIYGYIKSCNPDSYDLITGEGFGEHLHGPAGGRVMAQCIRDRDFIESMRTIYPIDPPQSSD
jgi:hypothetical protein